MALHIDAELNVIELAMARCSGLGIASNTTVSRMLISAALLGHIRNAIWTRW